MFEINFTVSDYIFWLVYQLAFCCYCLQNYLCLVSVNFLCGFVNYFPNFPFCCFDANFEKFRIDSKFPALGLSTNFLS